MRKELYNAIRTRLEAIYIVDGGLVYSSDEAPEGGERLVKHIDLWNRNVEFIEQEPAWERPAVFVEFCDIAWNALVPYFEYRAEAAVRLHIVFDWDGTGEVTEAFDLSDCIHKSLCFLRGDSFKGFDLAGSITNHDHEEIVESIDTYNFVAMKKI